MATAERTLALDQLTPQAWAHISAAYALDQSENILALYAAWMLEREELDFHDAYTLCERLLKLDPKDVSYYVLLARLYARFHRHAEASQVLARAQDHARSLEQGMRLRMAVTDLQRSARDDDPNFVATLLAGGHEVLPGGVDELAVVMARGDEGRPGLDGSDGADTVI